MNLRRLVASVTFLHLVPGAALLACELESAAPAESAQQAYFDPQTGKLGAPPEGAWTPSGEGGAVATEPLVVVPGKTSAGGVMIQLRGRRHAALEAKLTPGGDVATDCVQRNR
jgi:hypothetical protein